MRRWISFSAMTAVATMACGIAWWGCSDPSAPEDPQPDASAFDASVSLPTDSAIVDSALPMREAGELDADVTDSSLDATPPTTGDSGLPAWPPVDFSAADASDWSRPPFREYGTDTGNLAIHPALGDLAFGRFLNDAGADGGVDGGADASTAPDEAAGFSLVWVTLKWSTAVPPQLMFAKQEFVVDTSSGEVALGDGHIVSSFFDASVTIWNGEIWVAAICSAKASIRVGQPNAYPFSAPSTCVGPLGTDMKLDLSRTAIVVAGRSVNEANPQYPYLTSAGVPKIINYGGKVFLYWDVNKYPKSSPFASVQITGRGVELMQEPTKPYRLWAASSTSPPAPIGTYILTDDPGTVEVFGVDPSDPRSNVAADLSQVLVNGNVIYFSGARGGCSNPGGSGSGCYRTTLGRLVNPNPLGYHMFNADLIPDDLLPDAPVSYPEFLYRPEDGRTILYVAVFGGSAYFAQNLNTAFRGSKAFLWPDDLLDTAPGEVPSAYKLTCAITDGGC